VLRKDFNDFIKDFDKKRKLKLVFNVNEPDGAKGEESKMA